MREVYLWQKPDWPHFTWSADLLIVLLGEVRNLQGQLAGRMSVLGFEGLEQQLEAMTQEIVGSSLIEGVQLNAQSVRSSLARHLGMDALGDIVPDHYSEGVVNAMMEATSDYQAELTSERLFDWHSALFPTGRSNGIRITVADWRKGEEPMQVVSGALGHEKIHYEAPPSSLVPSMMNDFIQWVNTPDITDPLIRAAIAHLWVVSIHPFDDGNGRITRTITELMLARADGMPQRFYSMSAEIMRQRKNYYDVLEKAQHGSMDVTQWIIWFLSALKESITTALNTTDRTLKKTAFWKLHGHKVTNDRQRKILNMLWDGFEGKLTTQKYARIAHCSHDTALRDIQQLVETGILSKSTEGGRSTSYLLSDDVCSHFDL